MAAVIGEGSELILIVGSGHEDQVGGEKGGDEALQEGGNIGNEAVEVQAAIAGGGDEQHAVGAGVFDGGDDAHGGGAVGDVGGVDRDDVDAGFFQGDQIVDPGDDVGIGGPGGGADFDWQYGDVGGDRENRGGDGGAVEEVIRDVIVVIDEIPAVKIVDEIVAGEIAGVGPEMGGEEGIVEIDAGVEDGDDDVGAAAGNVPGGGGVDVSAGGSGGGAIDGVGEGLAGVLKPPFLGKGRGRDKRSDGT